MRRASTGQPWNIDPESYRRRCDTIADTTSETRRTLRRSQTTAKDKNKMSGGKFKKFASVSGGRTMWQIVWAGDGEDGQEEEVDETVVDASNMEYNDEDLNSGGPPGDDEVVFDRTKGKNGYSKNATRMFDASTMEMQPEREFTGNFLMRRDSDSDLILKTSAASQLSARLRYCWVNCTNPIFWKTYWWLPLAIVLACVIYISVVCAIVFTLGD